MRRKLPAPARRRSQPNAPTPPGGRSVPLWFLGVLVVLLLGCGIGLLLTARTIPQVQGAYVLLSLAVAVITYGVLKSTGKILQAKWQFSGAFAGFVVTLMILLKTVAPETVDVVGDLYIDGEPPATAAVSLLETDVRDNTKVLSPADRGRFAFRQVLGIRDSVRLQISLSDKLSSRVITCAWKGVPIRVELSSKDFAPRERTDGGVEELEISGCEPDNGEQERLFLFDLAATGLAPEKCNAFLNVLSFKLNNDVRSHLESYQLLGDRDFLIERCPGTPIQMKAQAVKAGQHLKAPAVLWGFAEAESNVVQSVLWFTALVGTPETVPVCIRSTSELTDLVQTREPVSPACFALASYILGREYLEGGDRDLARRCFLHAQELQALPPTLDQEVSRLLAPQASDPTHFLNPIGAGL